MEQEFYRDEFEQLLKDTTDDFKMYPSRKVWHSIYNDLHPDRKWPSFAVCLLLLTTILYIGVTNNNNISNKNKRNTAGIAYKDNNTQTGDKAETAQQPVAKVIPLFNNNQFAQNITTPVLIQDIVIEEDRFVTPTIIEENNGETGHNRLAENTTTNIVQNTNAENNAPVKSNSFENTRSFTTEGSTRMNVTAAVAEADEEEVDDNKSDDDKNVPGSIAVHTTDIAVATAEEKASLKILLAKNDITKDNSEKEWIEDFAFHNRTRQESIKNLFKGLSTQFYVTPSIGYRVMFRNYDQKGMENSLVTNNAARNAEEKVTLNQQAAMNMEAGVGIIKDLNKKLRFKTGLQFNYTDYITYAQKLQHPTQTNMAVSSQGAGINLASYSADYAHTPGKNSSKLHNSTIQLSIPVGVDYRIMSNKVLNWYVGATVQPTLVARSNTYMLSADNNYFVEDQAMLRKWNLNGAVESFVSFKTASGTFINLGPQFRYQLFSSYNKSYTYTEKPYSIGFKIGFTRPL